MEADDLLLAGRPVDAIAEASAALGRPGADERDRLAHVAVLVLASALTGAGDRSVAQAVEALPTVLRLVDTHRPVARVPVGQCVALWLTGRAVDLDAFSRISADRAVAHDAGELLGSWTFFIGRAALDRGQVRTAAARCAEAAHLLEAADTGRTLPWCLATWAQASAQAGDLAAAEVLLDRVSALGAPPLYDAERLLAGAWVAAAGGDVRRGAARAIEAADVAAATGQRAVEVRALHEAVRLGAAAEVATRLAAVEPVDGPLPPVLVAHGTAVARRDADALDVVAEDAEALSALLVAAEASAAAARIHGEEGRAGRRLASLDRLARTSAACEGARTPALEGGGGGTPFVWLTRREREVVELAGAGLTKREIAERLEVSVRTVGNHLNRAYGKLGTSSREDLRRLFHPT